MRSWRELRFELVGDRDRSSIPPKVPVPSFPKALLEFMKAAEREDVSAKELGKIIETDAGLTIELVKYANSSAIGLRHPVSTPQQVLSILGPRRVKSFLIQSVCSGIARSSNSRFLDADLFSRVNLERSCFARSLAETMKLDGEIAYNAALMQDFLVPMLLQQHEAEYASYFEGGEEVGSLRDFEQQHFGFDHADAGARLLLQWDFPDELICCVHRHHDFAELIKDRAAWETELAPVAVSALLPAGSRVDASAVRTLAMLDEQWPEFKLLERAAAVDASVQEFLGESDHGLSARLERCGFGAGEAAQV